MLVTIDLKAAEWMSLLYFSKDTVGIQEWKNDDDIHSINQCILDLPTRDAAKRFLFSSLYGRSIYTFTIDPVFAKISKDYYFWEKVYEKFNAKYETLHDWKECVIRDACKSGCIKSPTGRLYIFESYGGKGNRLAIDTQITKFISYLNQGFCSDICTTLFVDIRRSLKDLVKPVYINHDSITLEFRKCNRAEIECIIKDRFSNSKEIISKSLGIDDFDIDVRYTIKYSGD